VAVRDVRVGGFDAERLSGVLRALKSGDLLQARRFRRSFASLSRREFATSAMRRLRAEPDRQGTSLAYGDILRRFSTFEERGHVRRERSGITHRPRMWVGERRVGKRASARRQGRGG